MSPAGLAPRAWLNVTETAGADCRPSAGCFLEDRKGMEAQKVGGRVEAQCATFPELDFQKLWPIRNIYECVR